MSTQVALPAAVPATSEPVVTTTAAQEPAVAPGSEADAPAPAATTAAAEEHDSHDGAGSGAPAHGKKRSPFGDLKNKLFHKSTSPTRAKSHEHAAAATTEETPKENAPIMTQEAAAAPTEAESVPAPAAAVEGGHVAAPATEVHAHHDEEAHKKPKSPGVLEKVKSFFGENKKDKKVKTPTEEKPEPPATAVAPVSTSPEAETAAASVETTEASVTAPETVAAAEAATNSSAPVPQVIEPIPAPVDEPAVTTEAPVSVIESETTAATATGVKPEGEEAKAGEQTKTDEKAPKRDLAKLSRRLSAKVGALLHSPKKEKKEKDAALHVEGGETTSAEAPKIETAVDVSKLDAASTSGATKSETVGATAIDPLVGAETAPVQAEAGPVAETKTETPAAVPVVAATA
ncbi:hypothetical protein JCM3774_001087 [Rhodotorula dairenensis]